ncbi:MAG TPA: dTMP kinase, partial [Verrucomicrobiae bacterium]|nr:dTMP kinase [Verrucomicrobiae bacterium]
AYGRGLDLKMVEAIIEVAVGKTRPDLTFLLEVSAATSRERMQKRSAGTPAIRDRFEEAGEEFFARVADGYKALAAAEPGRVKRLDAEKAPEQVSAAVWQVVESMLGRSR